MTANYKVNWCECGSYEDYEKEFNSIAEAKKYYDEIVSEHKTGSIFIELVFVLESITCEG